jgi:hypothetical protein
MENEMKFHQVFIKAFADGEESHDGSSKFDEWFQVSCQTEEEFSSAEDVVASFKERQWQSVIDRHKEYFHPKKDVNWKHIIIEV